MRSSDSPYLADWLAVSLRWLGLLGVVIVLALNNALELPGLAAVLAGTLWNIFISLLASLNRRLGGHRPINLLVDLAVFLALFYFTGGIEGPTPWCSILPLFSAAIYYEVRGGLWMAVLASGLQAGLAAWQAQGQPAWLLLGLLAGINLALGLVLGLVSRRLMQRIRAIYQNQLRQRKEAERKAILAERSRMQAFMSMVETLSSTLNYKMVLNTTLDLCANAAGAEGELTGQMLSAVLLFGEHDLRVEVGRRMSPRDTRLSFPAEAGVLHAALQGAEPCLVENPAKDPELGRIVVMDTCKAALVIPLRRGVNAYGMMLFAHPDPQFFTTERVEVLDMVGQQAVIAIQNARLYQDLEVEKERIAQIQEETRKKLARDLHDGPIQSVAAIAMRTNVAHHAMQMDLKTTEAELGKIEDLARRTTKELRHMLFTLRPLALETEGLAAALKTMADKTRETFQQNVEVEVEQKIVDQLELNKQTVVFYLVEEAVNNARKHAGAERIMVRLRGMPQDAYIAALEIIDNGKGFNVQQVMDSYQSRGSLGMVNLRERADLINGLLQIDSEPGKGTRVRVLIPLNEEAADRLQQGKTSR